MWLFLLFHSHRLHMFRLYFKKASTGRTIKCYQNGSFFIDLQPPLKWISISHSDSNSLRSIQINLFFLSVSLFEILFHSIHATAFYLFYDRPKKKKYLLLLLYQFIGWTISDVVSCVCSILIHLFDDSFFYFFFIPFGHSIMANEIWGIQEIDVTIALSTRNWHKILFNTW